MKILVDTNVWLDIAFGREGFYEDSFGAVATCIEDENELLTVATSLKDAFYIVERHSDAQQAYEWVEKIMAISSIVSVDQLTCHMALDLEKPDFEDGIIAACARIENVDVIISSDKSAYESIGIPCRTPSAYIEASPWTRTRI
ncbi:MAG: PIN domain-containing protein [Coriobacteriales bacterium]